MAELRHSYKRIAPLVNIYGKKKWHEADVRVCNNLALDRWKILSVWQEKVTERCF